MINVIFPIDPSTHFLSKIVNNLVAAGVVCNVIEIQASPESYEECKTQISEIPFGSDILFLGHGQSDRLYGGESNDFEKKEIISRREMALLKGQNLFALACDSSILLKQSFLNSGIKKSIGFGALPTEMYEIENIKKLSGLGINQEIIEAFKERMIDIVSNSLMEYKARRKDFAFLYDFMCLLLNKEINNSVLFRHNRLLADLLYKMKSEMTLF